MSKNLKNLPLTADNSWSRTLAPAEFGLEYDERARWVAMPTKQQRSRSIVASKLPCSCSASAFGRNGIGCVGVCSLELGPLFAAEVSLYEQASLWAKQLTVPVSYQMDLYLPCVHQLEEDDEGRQKNSEREGDLFVETLAKRSLCEDFDVCSRVHMSAGGGEPNGGRNQGCLHQPRAVRDHRGVCVLAVVWTAAILAIFKSVCGWCWLNLPSVGRHSV